MASSDLESLDNKALRAKCIEYGLPNVPITDTSRKILIKKLKAVMEGTTTGAKTNKARRETIHVTSTTTTVSAAEKEDTKASTAKSRRTIAAVRKEKEPTPKEPARISERRRSSRSTPIQEISNSTSLPKKNIPVVIEETDFDEEFVLVEDDIPPPIITNIPIRKSHSPSLGKSVVVTTSYKKDEPKEPKIDEEEETEEEGYTEKNKEYNLSRQFMTNRETRDSIGSTIPRYNFSSVISSSIEKESFPSGYKPLYPSLNTPIETSGIKSSYEIKSSYDTLTKRTPYILKPNSLSSKIPTGSRKSVDTDLGESKKIHTYVENSDSNAEDDDIIQQAPYLSEFARRLSSLKAEKLDAGIDKSVFNVGTPITRTVGRRTYVSKVENSGIGDSLREFWIAVDRKYKIKKFLFIVTVLTSVILFAYYYYLYFYNSN